MQRKALGIYAETVGEKSEEVGLLYLGMSITEITAPGAGVSNIETASEYSRKGIEILESAYPEGRRSIEVYSRMIESFRKYAMGSTRAGRTLQELERKLEASKRVAAQQAGKAPQASP